MGFPILCDGRLSSSCLIPKKGRNQKSSMGGTKEMHRAEKEIRWDKCCACVELRKGKVGMNHLTREREKSPSSLGRQFIQIAREARVFFFSSLLLSVDAILFFFLKENLIERTNSFGIHLAYEALSIKFRLI